MPIGTDPLVQHVWETYVKWCTAQGYLKLYKDGMAEVDTRLKGMVEQQKELFYQLTTFSQEKPKDEKHLDNLTR